MFNLLIKDRSPLTPVLKRKSRKFPVSVFFFVSLSFLFAPIAFASDEKRGPDTRPGAAVQKSDVGGAEAMARKLQDPLANIAALMTDNDILFNTGDDSTTYSFQLQPVYSLNFPEAGFTLIPRLIIPILGVPSLSSYWKLGDQRPQSGGTTSGMGDMVTQVFFAPFTTWLWKFGFGPQISLKTRTDEILDGPSWGAGPAAVLTGPITENITFAGILGQLWSFDGDFSTMTVQPGVFYNFDAVPGLYVGYNGIVALNWKADSGNGVNLPLGGVVGQTFDLGEGYGFDISLGAYGYPVRPSGAADWSVKFGISFVFPK